MNKLTIVPIAFLALVLLVPGNALASSDVSVFVSGKALQLKQVEDSDPVQDFKIEPESVVQVEEGSNLIVLTQPEGLVENVKINVGNDQRIDLVEVDENEYSLFSFLAGVYLLNVIVDQPNSDKSAAYETVLVILEKGQQPLQPIQVINQVKVKIITETVFTENDHDGKDRGHKKCSDKEGSAGLAFPFGKRTECELEKFQDCKEDKLKGLKWGDDCKDNNHAFEDDCEGFANQRECDEHWNTPPVIPPCGEGREDENGLCRDEGDDITCDGPAVPVGNECVLPPVEPEIPIDNGPVVPPVDEPIIPIDPEPNEPKEDATNFEETEEPEETTEEPEVEEESEEEVEE